MKYFPAFVDLKGKPTLVAGSADPARVQMLLQKARLFLEAGAAVDLLLAEFEKVDPAQNEDLKQTISESLEIEFGIEKILARLRFVDWQHIETNSTTYRLMIAASGIKSFDQKVVALANNTGTLINVVDQMDACDFITPSIVDRGDVLVGISSSGTSPVLARRLRQSIEQLLPARLGALAAFAGHFRQLVKSKIDKTQRRTFWERFFDSPIADRILSGKSGDMEAQMLNLIDEQGAKPSLGRVFIVGTGPGDAELLTLKAMRIMQQADIVFYDKLIGPDILNFVRRDAERVFVGKTRACHVMAQDEINRQMAEQAKAGRIVVRLKGGDPFVFGRGGEELDFLQNENIPVEIVPGITAALGCAASVDIPLTHRDHAQAVTFVTGHGKAGTDNLDWTALAGLKQTLVFYMGVNRASTISLSLIKAGLISSTPVAVIENGTLSNERLIRGKLSELPALVEDQHITGPAIFVVGDVAKLGAAEVLSLTSKEHAPGNSNNVKKHSSHTNRKIA